MGYDFDNSKVLKICVIGGSEEIIKRHSQIIWEFKRIFNAKKEIFIKISKQKIIILENQQNIK